MRPYRLLSPARRLLDRLRPRPLDRLARGRRAERAAERELRRRGWRTLGRRLRTPAGELDLVATRGDELLFVEVKGRRRGLAVEALGPAQRRRVVRAAAWYMEDRGVGSLYARVGVAGVELDDRGLPQGVTLVEDALDAEGTPR
ncbi:MAG: YraN family protein [Planctomycetes bacterium]|nr:YraN family protein [Planctomycetota bacterium]